MKCIKTICVLAGFALLATGSLSAETPSVSDTVSVHNACIPVISGRERNIVAELAVKNPGAIVDFVEISIDGLDQKAIKDVSLIYTGTTSLLFSRTTSYILVDEYRAIGSGQDLYLDPDYTIVTDSGKPDKNGKLTLYPNKKLFLGNNYFYLSIKTDPKKIDDRAETFNVNIDKISINGKNAVLKQDGSTVHRHGTALRQHGDDNVFAYRIPGLTTTANGTLIAVYDVRNDSQGDLQDNVDIGMSRSTDGGRTWEKMQIIMDMGESFGLPQSQNGIGDPCVVADPNTGYVFAIAMWASGFGNQRAWGTAGNGFEHGVSTQLMVTVSKDDGKTWSKPENINRQIKDSTWMITLQGPGRGICMEDGTLVVPIQHVEPDRVAHAGIMYSKDQGKTWRRHEAAFHHTTESQVVEITPGVLMLNMRNDRRTGRVVCTTKDLGKTWEVHPSSEKLQESVCMASLLKVGKDENVLGKDILLFSNPNTTKGRNHITIKASLDGGMTWNDKNSVLLDEEEGWGYSCMTLIDKETIGILYEGSTAHLVFQTVKLKDIVK